jgi:hypothetical protein
LSRKKVALRNFGRDRQIAHHSLNALLIGVVIFPAPEVADKARAELRCPAHSLPTFGVLDDGSGRRELAAGHFPGLSRPSTSRSINCVASLPDSILPICSGGIAVSILALSRRPSQKGTPGARSPSRGDDPAGA